MKKLQASMDVSSDECVQQNALSHESYPRSLDQFIDRSAIDQSHHHNQQAFTFIRHKWRYWLIFLSLGMANSSDASEILCISYVLSLADFQDQMLLQQEDGSHHHSAGLLASAVFGGMLLGGLLVGSLGDYRGRRPMLLLGLALNGFAGVASACLTTQFTLLCLVRFVAGIGIGATVPPLFTLCSELPSAAHRGFWVTLCASFWMVGSIYVAVVGWFLLAVLEQSWRRFVLACALPSALGWIMVYSFVPESPRFLLLHGRYDRAAATANYLAECLGEPSAPLTTQELKDYDEKILQENLALEEKDSLYISPRGFVATSPTEQTLLEFLQTTLTDFRESTGTLYTVSPSLRNTTIILQTIWFSLSFGSYGLLTWINTLFVQVHLDNVYRNAILFALANLPGNIVSALLMDRLGRIKLFMASIFLASSSLLVFAYIVATTESNPLEPSQEPSPSLLYTNLIVAAACLFQCCSIAAWNAMDVLTSELFPTVVRASGMGLCTASGRVGAMLAQLVNGSLLKQPVKLLVVAAVTLLVGAVAPVSLPDRTGEPVSDRIPLGSEVTQKRSLDGGSYQQVAIVQTIE